MSKLDELIKKYCPNGVRFSTIQNIVFICPKDHITKNQLCSRGYPVINSSQKALGYFGKCNNTKNTLVLTSHGAYAGYSIFMECDFFAGPLCYPMKEKDSKILNIKFLYYFFKNSESEIREKFVNKSGVPYVNFKQLLQYKIPLPPIEVQNEIVRILDSFTQFEAELTAELTLRKKQYEYYRDNLILNSSQKMVSLEEISKEMYRGSGIKRNEITEQGTPCIRYGEIYTTYPIYFENALSKTNAINSNTKYASEGDVLFAITGESVEEIGMSTVYLGKEKIAIGGDIVVLKHSQYPQYLAFALSTKNAIKQKSHGKIKSKVVHTNIPSLQSIKIPLPNIEQQKHLSSYLEKFFLLIYKIKSGLPKEIELRHKQYEYYRNKLLTFKELKA